MSQVTSYTTPSSPLTMLQLATALNAIFAALGSFNREATAPDNPFEGMLWWDTSGTPTEILKRYTVTAGWVSLLTVNITTGDYTITGYVPNSLFDANTILYATTDNVPAALTISASRVAGRKASGDIAALTMSEVLDLVGSAAQGDILYRGAALWSRLAKGTALQGLRMNSGATAPEWATITTDNFLHVRDQKADGTDGGTFTKDVWQTRTLQTTAANTIAGASLAANQITLPVGTYYIDATAPGFKVSFHKARLRNITDGSTTLVGTTEKSGTAYGDITKSHVTGRFTIAGAKVFEIQHLCNTTENTDGYGQACTFGVVEIYTDVKIWKIS